MMIKTFALFVATALAEITGCYLLWLWLRKGGSVWLLVPACLSLAVFAWLLTLHPAPVAEYTPPMAAYTWLQPSCGCAL